MSINLVLPGLLWYNIEDSKYLYPMLKIDNFKKLIKKSSVTIHKFGYSDLIYNKLFDNNINGSLANFLVKNQNISDKYTTFLVAQPTNLRVQNDGLTPTEPESLQLTSVEEHSIITIINNHFNHEIKVYYVTNNLWLIGLNFSLANSKFYPIVDMLGENIDDYLPHGEHNILFSKILNEIQMLLHDLDINKNRKNNGDLPVNSIWMWDKQIMPLDFLNQETTSVETTLVNTLYYPCCYRDSSNWITNIETLDVDIAKTLNQQLYSGKIKILRLFIPRKNDTIEIKLTYRSKYKFWKNNNFYKIIKDAL
jgi:hypothetical protein